MNHTKLSTNKQKDLEKTKRKFPFNENKTAEFIIQFPRLSCDNKPDRKHKNKNNVNI